jgi:hypothetical protein
MCQLAALTSPVFALTSSQLKSFVSSHSSDTLYAIGVKNDSDVYDVKLKETLHSAKANDVLIMVGNLETKNSAAYAKVLLDGEEGYIKATSLKLDSKKQLIRHRVDFTISLASLKGNLNVYQKASKSASVVSYVRKGALVPISGYNKSYYKVTLPEGYGFVSNSNIDRVTKQENKIKSIADALDKTNLNVFNKYQYTQNGKSFKSISVDKVFSIASILNGDILDGYEVPDSGEAYIEFRSINANNSVAGLKFRVYKSSNLVTGEALTDAVSLAKGTYEKVLEIVNGSSQSSGSTASTGSTAVKLGYIKTSPPRGVDNVFLATCTSKVSGSDQILSESADPSKEALETTYRFSVNENLFGYSAQSPAITLISNIGNVFEVGKQYAVALIHNLNAYYDQYYLVGHKLFVPVSALSEADLTALRSA